MGQEEIVLAIACALFAAFSIFLPNFLAPENIINLVRSVAVLGILGIGMAVVVIGRGIDLSIIANMAISVAWALQLMNTGTPIPAALCAGAAFATLMGMVNGLLVAYVEVPSLFATLAMGTFIYGIGRFQLIPLDVIYLPPSAQWLDVLGKGRLAGIPLPIFVFALIAATVHLILRYLKAGQEIYTIGDNLAAARITGIPVRPIVVGQYILSALIAYAAGLVTAAAVSSMNTRIVNSTQIYDVILVVVLGGVGLSGARGGVRNVIVGTLLIGTLVDGMTILDISYTIQNMIKGFILLFAIIADGVVNPRDEQTAQQGDI